MLYTDKTEQHIYNLVLICKVHLYSTIHNIFAIRIKTVKIGQNRTNLII